ncbi:hypothetical protein AQUCO_07600034v1, partial [Aquilegia coerulea]
AVLEQLASIIRQEVEQEVALLVGVRKEVENLTDILTILCAVIEDAEEKQVKNKSVKVWLEQLKDISYDAEDVLDEWNTKTLISRIQRLDASAPFNKKVWSNLFAFFSCFKSVGVRHNIGVKLRELNERLDGVAKKKELYNLTEIRHHEEPRLITSSFVDVSKIYGRVADKDIILSHLLGESSHQKIHVPVISIVGTGGFGKTTLAQLILQDEQVMTNFDTRMWVCVSDPFDLEKVAKEIIQKAKGEVPNMVGWPQLHESLSMSIQGKCFILVLDDVWSYNDEHWRQLKLSLDCGAVGSRIILTTRNERITKMMCSTYIHRLGQLSDDDSWSLFASIAFWGRQGDPEKFEDIGKDIAKKCKGVPLAVKVLASLMHFKTTKQDWRNVLASDIWELQEIEEGVLPSLLLSYYALPSQLKPCFMYCATFKKGSKIKKDELVKLWMAQGFLGSDGSKDLERIGAGYFDNLAMRSFFQDFDKDEEENIVSFMMHDLVHDVAQFLAKSESFISEKADQELSGVKIRHLSGSHLNNSSIYKQKKLRTLRQFVGWSSTKVPLELFHELTCLRALDLQDCPLEELPSEVDRLLQLRYLDLSQTGLTKLPETICCLYNLETLKLNRCKDLSSLPDGIGKLTNLRHLELKKPTSISYFPRGIGKLSCLRTLDNFIVGGHEREGQGCKVGELKLLNHLQGQLRISGLGQVAGGSEAKMAELNKKENIHSLKLVFEEQRDEKRIEEILENLKPHADLEKLEIKGYSGLRLPLWMCLSSNLVELKLKNCTQCLQLPALGKLASLEVLILSRLKSLKRVGSEFYGLPPTGIHSNNSCSGSEDPVVIFPKLKKLHFLFVVEWEEWDLPFQNNLKFFPALLELRILFCRKLQALPALGKLESLETLECERLDELKCLGLEFLGLSGDDNEGELAPVTVFPALRLLQLKSMLEWEQHQVLSTSGSTTIMPRLSTLVIEYCPKLCLVPHYMFSLALTDLHIADCSQLTGMQPFLPSLLEKLRLKGDIGVFARSLPIGTSQHNNYPYLSWVIIADFPYSSLPNGFNQLQAIRKLDIFQCEFFDFMPEDLKHLTILEELKIFRCLTLGQRFRDAGISSLGSNVSMFIID